MNSWVPTARASNCQMGLRGPVHMLEIGVQHGGSLQIWRRYFAAEAVIWVIDIDPRCAAIHDLDLHERIGSQDDPAFLKGVVGAMGGVDIVVV